MTGAPALPARAQHLAPAHMVHIPAGEFRMGSDLHYPEERPEHRACVDSFWMGATAVTNAAFNDFVAATGYVTVAERALDSTTRQGAWIRPCWRQGRWCSA